jgi:hypothetical protein
MRWVLAIVLVLVLGLVGAFAVYTFGWRDDDDADERTRALIAIEELRIEAACFPPACDAENVEQLAPQIWRVEFLRRETANQLADRACYAIHLDRFRVLGIDRSGNDVRGLARITCR